MFCGTAAGRQSAARGAYYAGRGNRFWPVLAETGLVSRRLEPEDFQSLEEFGIGLTDIVKRASGADVELSREDFDTEAFEARMRTFSPRFIAFNGKKAASRVLKCSTKKIRYGLQTQKIGETRLFVLPSTSGAARRFWDIQHWLDLAALVSRR